MDGGAVKTELEKVFDLLENDAGEFMLAIASRPGRAEGATLCLSADSRFPVLRRGDGIEIGLPDMGLAALEKLAQVKQIIVAEMEDGSLVSAYDAIIEA